MGPFGINGLAIDDNDRLFVTDSKLHHVLVFNAQHQQEAVVGADILVDPGGIAIDRARNRRYVADATAGSVAVFDTQTLKLVGYFGSPTKPGRRDNGTFQGPTNVAVDRKGIVYVADTLIYRIQIFDPAGTFVRVFGVQGDSPGEFIRPKGVAVDSEGHVYVADAEFNNFQILTPEGRPLLAVGSLGDEPGRFALLAGMYIDAQDKIYTTEMFHGRIQVFQYIRQPDSVAEKEVNGANSQ